MGFFSSNDSQFLADFAAFAKMRDMITNARQTMLIVSPYIDPPDDFIRQLVAAVDRNVAVTVLFRKDKLGEYQTKPWLHALESAGVRLGCIDRLHSKIYANEHEILVTSMNFLTTSGENSFEVGIHFTAENPLARSVKDYLAYLARHTEPLPANDRVSASSARRKAQSPAARSKEERGHCIRCGTDIALNPSKPYCPADYREWAEYENEDYEDRYCHCCGKAHRATMRKPLCRTCFKQVA